MDAKAKARAEALAAAITDGKTIFTKRGDGWVIAGPAADVVSGQVVTVTKADGSASEVYVTKVLGTGVIRDGKHAWAVALFASYDRPARPVDTSHATVTSPVYGEGRRYAHTPGATNYDDGSGTYRVQIWDES